MSIEQLNDKDQRKLIADNLRFYADARFKQLSLFLAWITLLAGGLFQFGDKQLARDLNISSGLPIFAMLVTAVFWVLEIRASLFWRAHRDVAPDLWPRPPSDGWSWLSSTNAVFVLYASIYFVWLLLSIKLSPHPVFYLLPGLLGVTIFAFGVTSYIRYSSPGSTRT